MAASRLLLAAAACVILLSFAAGLGKSYWSGCMKAATVICQQIFFILALAIFLKKILFKNVQNCLFFALASRSGFAVAISDAVARSSIVFRNLVFADRIVMAASRLLLATAACVILLSFASGLRKSYWCGCMKAATVICQQIFFVQKRRDELKLAPMHEKAWAALRWHEIAKKNVADIWEDMKRDEKSSDVKCEGCNVKCEESACLTLHCTWVARRSCSWTQQHSSSFAKRHARTGLAGARRMQVPWL